MQPGLIDFMRQVRNRYAPTTYDRMMWEMGKFEQFLTERKLELHCVTKVDLEAYLSSMSCGYETKHRRLITLRQLYKYLKIEENPASKIHMRPFKKRVLVKEPHREQVNRTLCRLDHPRTELELRNRLIFELLYGSGIRRTELTRINIEDVDLINRTIQILGKGNKMRMVPITAVAADALQQYCEVRNASNGPLLVTYYGKRLLPVSIYLICRMKIGIRPHLLRHACASHMLKNGCDIRHIQELLGHNNLTTTQIYTHTDKKDLREVIDRVHPRSIYHRAPAKVKSEEC